jgi:hypothetical protein
MKLAPDFERETFFAAYCSRLTCQYNAAKTGRKPDRVRETRERESAAERLGAPREPALPP